MNDITHHWNRIEAWLQVHAPEALTQFRPPATSEMIARAGVALNTLAADYRDLIQIHDGVRNASFGAGVLEDFVLYSLEDALDSRQEMQRVAQEGREAYPDIRDSKMKPDPGVRQVWWHDAWLPVAVAAGDPRTMIFLDLDPAPGGTRGQLVRHVIDEHGLTVVARSVGEWLTRIVLALESGQVRVERDDDGELAGLRWPAALIDRLIALATGNVGG